MRALPSRPASRWSAEDGVPVDGALGQITVEPGDQAKPWPASSKANRQRRPRHDHPEAAATGVTLDALFRQSVRIFADWLAITSDEQMNQTGPTPSWVCGLIS